MAFIEASSVSKAFGTGAGARHVLEDVTLTVDEGEFVSIVGFVLDRLMSLVEQRFKTA